MPIENKGTIIWGDESHTWGEITGYIVPLVEWKPLPQDSFDWLPAWNTWRQSGESTAGHVKMDMPNETWLQWQASLAKDICSIFQISPQLLGVFEPTNYREEAFKLFLEMVHDTQKQE